MFYKPLFVEKWQRRYVIDSIRHASETRDDSALKTAMNRMNNINAARGRKGLYNYGFDGRSKYVICDGNHTIYHATSYENAEKIVTKGFVPKHDRNPVKIGSVAPVVFFSGVPLNANGDGCYGPVSLAVTSQAFRRPMVYPDGSLREWIISALYFCPDLINEVGPIRSRTLGILKVAPGYLS